MPCLHPVSVHLLRVTHACCPLIPQFSWENNRRSRKCTTLRQTHTHWLPAGKLTGSLTKRSSIGGSSTTLLSSSLDKAWSSAGLCEQLPQVWPATWQGTPTRPNGARKPAYQMHPHPYTHPHTHTCNQGNQWQPYHTSNILITSNISPKLQRTPGSSDPGPWH